MTIELTEIRKNAFRQRYSSAKARERSAAMELRNKACNRFQRDYLRQLNIRMAAIASIMVLMIAVVACATEEEGAKPGRILAKSELSKQEIAQLNIMPVKAGVKHALRK